ARDRLRQWPYRSHGGKIEIKDRQSFYHDATEFTRVVVTVSQSARQCHAVGHVPPVIRRSAESGGNHALAGQRTAPFIRELSSGALQRREGAGAGDGTHG